MTIHTLWLFAPSGDLLFYREWSRRKHTRMDRAEEAKLLYGMLFSTKAFVRKLSPTHPEEGFLSYKTSAYRLSFFEAPTGVKFVVTTDTAVGHPICRDLLKTIYSQVYVEYAIKNPMYEQGKPIEAELFATKLDEVVRASPLFKA